jgi:DNA-binding CsgD family transcriptional regulator/DNA polymerase III delta prime subunit
LSFLYSRRRCRPEPTIPWTDEVYDVRPGARADMGDTASGIVGRERELSALARFVEGLADRPHDLLLVGEAGIGKTTLWRVGVEDALGAGRRVLVSSPAENDMMLTYGAIGDLIGDVFDEAIVGAPGPQRTAMEIALLRRPPGELAPDQRVIALAVREALRTLSTSSPLVLALDDIQWLDPSSARALAFALRRLTGYPVAVLATRRLEDDADPARLTATLKDRAAVRVDVGPLDIDEVGRILRHRSGRPLAPNAVRRIHETGRGNPFFALELAREIGDTEPAAGAPLPIPREVRDRLVARIERLSPEGRMVTLDVAAMSRPTIDSLRSAQTTPSTADAGLAEAEAAGILAVHGGRIGFVHPLLGSAAYWSTSRRARLAVHARLAQVVVDAEERARHIALSAAGPDPVAASFVEDAADDARRRGAPLAAAELLELSAKLTPRDDDAQLCNRRRLAALNRFDAGDVRRARSMLQTSIEESSSRQQRAMTRLELAARSYNDVDRVDDLLSAALPDVGVGRPIAFANLAWVAIFRLQPERAADRARAAIELAERASEQTYLRVALGALGHAQAFLGFDAGPTMQRATAITANISPGESAHPSSILGHQMLWEGKVDEARRLVEEADAAYSQAGLELMRHDTLPVLSEVECAAGDWAAADLHANEAYDIVVDAGLVEMRDQMLHAKSHVAALLGRIDDARRDATEGASLAAAQGNRWAEVDNRSVLGFIALSVGDPAEVVRVLEPAESLVSGSGIVEPGVFPFLPDLVEASVGLGRLDRAKQVVDRLHEEGLALDRALALATAARCRALIAAALGDPLGALTELERALAEHERVPIPFESARTRLINGEILRRMKRKRESRESLEDARSRFRALGARLWEARADEALARIGGRPASPTDLSETELRVADVVSLGLTNKETADRLFMSVKTVESNLRRVYRKLGVRSRTELARRHRPPDQGRRSLSDPDDQT